MQKHVGRFASLFVDHHAIHRDDLRQPLIIDKGDIEQQSSVDNRMNGRLVVRAALLQSACDRESSATALQRPRQRMRLHTSDC